LRKVDHGEQCPPTMKNAPFQKGAKQKCTSSNRRETM
jgi:hypothetical protein